MPDPTVPCPTCAGAGRVPQAAHLHRPCEGCRMPYAVCVATTSTGGMPCCDECNHPASNGQVAHA